MHYFSLATPVGGDRVLKCIRKRSLGIAGSWCKQSVFVGTAAKVNQSIADLPVELVQFADSLEQDGKTVVWVAQAQQVMGIIAIADQVRPEAARAIAQLKNGTVLAVLGSVIGMYIS
ncbi:hypothetical protein LC609_26675 [Nostoc sp. XA013]|nr:hypothetical protein [Nostoc sp. XA013]